ncbi:hypothetical protein L208DRAFT_1373404 [Tricholoma matsutake]|nr:hypothetical protein L208DRAFT_1373404 [Tricholoma matsutake 945]
MHAKDPSRNYIVCHTKHSYKFDGIRGRDWDHRHEELPVGIFGKTTGFEIYWFHSGTFRREGDGGYLNWSYMGNVVKKSSDGKELTFK